MELIIAFGLGAAVGVALGYLFFRANPNKKNAVDKWVNDNKE